VAVYLSRIELITSVSEIVGYKSGLTLSRDRFTQLIPQEYLDVWVGPDNQMVRIRSEEYEYIIANILYSLGNIRVPSTVPFGVTLFHKYKGNPESLKLYENVMQHFLALIRKGLEDEAITGNKVIDPTPFVEICKHDYGPPGHKMAIEVLDDFFLYQQRSPWAPFRRIEWEDTADLKDLFESESLDTFYGTFIDQRYIDYLSQNFDDIDKMNWRKFEGLTCEFYDRLGYYVEIGKGRDDDNIDARIWPKAKNRTQPPTILVQCKRQKQKVSKVVVKALWADITAENATSGLVVTTNALSPGADKVRIARGYPIDKAERESLRLWVMAMRTPDTGIVLGE